MCVTVQSLHSVFTKYKLLGYYFITILLSYLIDISQSQGRGRTTAMLPSLLTDPLARSSSLSAVRPLVYIPLFASPATRPSQSPALPFSARPSTSSPSPSDPLSRVMLLRRPRRPVPLRSTQPCLLLHCRQRKRRRVRRRNNK